MSSPQKHKSTMSSDNSKQFGIIQTQSSKLVDCLKYQNEDRKFI